MVLDRRVSHQIAQALLRSRSRSDRTDDRSHIGLTQAHTNGIPPTPLGAIISSPPEGSGEALWNWLTKPPPSSCPADSLPPQFPPFPPQFPPLEKQGNVGGSSKRGCDEEWKAAREICQKELLKRTPNRRMTGGHRDVEGCAKGFVSQRCGGNRVK